MILGSAENLFSGNLQVGDVKREVSHHGNKTSEAPVHSAWSWLKIVMLAGAVP
jgi:hypothetical protein